VRDNLYGPHLKRGTPSEIWLIKVEVTWGVWVLNEVSQAVTDVHRTPHSIRRPSSSNETGYDKGESVFPVRSGMFSARSHIHVGDRFENQLKKSVIKMTMWEIAQRLTANTANPKNQN
jgi:hypothetical protein